MLSDEVHQLGWVECRELVVCLELHTCLLRYVVEALAILATAESEKEALVAHPQRHRLCSAQEVDGVVYFFAEGSYQNKVLNVCCCSMPRIKSQMKFRA